MEIQYNALIKVDNSDIINHTCTIPTGITHIHNAFWKCTNLQNITIPEGVIRIGNLAFAECKNLKQITLPNSITSIGNAAFRKCESLETIFLPKGLIGIGKSAFSGCCNLKTIIFQERGARIESNAFSNCPSLTKIQRGKMTYRIKCIDGICMNILFERKKADYTVFKCQDFPAMAQTMWAVEKTGISASGTTISAAIRNLNFKLLKNKPAGEHINRIKSQGYVTPMDYSLITGMGLRPTDQFLKRRWISWNARWTIEEAISVTKGDYGHEAFRKTLKEYGCI